MPRPFSSRIQFWPFRDGEVPVRGRMRVNNLEAIRRAVLDGIGIAYLPSWMVWDQVRDGSLRVLLSDHAAGPTPIYAVYAAQRLLPQRAVVFTTTSPACLPIRPA